MATFDELAPGLSADAAIEAFLDGCNKGADRQNISSYRRRTAIPRLHALLPDPIDIDTAAALLDVVYRRRTLSRVMDWLAQQPMTWEQYEQEQQRHAAGREYEEMRRGYFPWVDVNACRRRDKFRWLALVSRQTARKTDAALERYGDRARACPVCGTPGRRLTWIDFKSRPETWQALCGRAGWLTVCDACQLQIDFFLEVLN